MYFNMVDKTIRPVPEETGDEIFSCALQSGAGYVRRILREPRGGFRESQEEVSERAERKLLRELRGNF